MGSDTKCNLIRLRKNVFLFKEILYGFVHTLSFFKIFFWTTFKVFIEFVMTLLLFDTLDFFGRKACVILTP